MNDHHDDFAGGVIPDEIQTLLERRSTFQAWLAKLDELEPEYRPEVAEKVRQDYESRLGAVERELGEHRDSLDRSLSERRGRVEELAARRDTRAAQMEEAKLRFQVGEFDEEEWERRRSEHEEALADVDAELEEQRGAVTELEEVLSELTGAAAPGSRAVEPSGQPDIAAAAVAAEADEEAAAVAPAWDEEPPEEPEREDGSEAAEDAEARDPGERDRNGEEFLDELEFLESLSLEEESFDAVSRMLDSEEGDDGAAEEDRRGG